MQTIYDVLVIGSGFSGICMGIKLKEAGIQNYLIVEKASELGGTWRENTYPGCACDVKSHLYSFSFEGNPNWSGAYSGWREIKTYIKHCADKYDITSHIQFNTEINSATFNAHKGIWIISDTNGQQFQSRTIVLGTGPLHVPAFPKIKGLEDFKGEIFHSARWNHRYNLNGKRVASIGTGASAIQYVPEIAPQVQQLDVYQRTPAWVLPRDENQYTETQKFIFKQVPAIRKFHRYAMYWFNETRLLPIKNPVIANALSVVAKSNIKKTIKSPELLKKTHA
jgi:cation diffusion facilitator CzcD-associated flavoprotein CzcO